MVNSTLMKFDRVPKVLIAIAVVIVVLVSATGGAISDRIFGYKLLDKLWPRPMVPGSVNTTQRVLTEENAVIDVADKVSPSVVTVGIRKSQVLRRQPQAQFGPFGFFDAPNVDELQPQDLDQDIGSGFVISADGLIVTNKHVVGDTDGTYRVVDKDDKTYEVEKVYRDPANDLAILKINASGLKPVEMGDSSKLKVGQFVVAIGTALGEFRHTVTTGVVSGLGRGITAGSPFEGFTEQLDNVIQTDAAINPGNSGGPLLNSAGQVIGVNTAISSQGQNIGFAIPINVVKDAINNFNNTGQFSRPFLGVRYSLIDQKTALLNKVPQGAYVQEVVADSPAAKAGIKADDIITKLGSATISGENQNGLASEIAKHKVGETVEAEIWRDGDNQTLKVTFEEAK